MTKKNAGSMGDDKKKLPLVPAMTGSPAGLARDDQQPAGLAGGLTSSGYWIE